MIKISAVSYLNTAPFIFGILKSGFLSPDEFVLTRENPAACAASLLRNDAQIGIVPVAIIPKLKNFSILQRTCIGANDHVDSVMLFSQVPLNAIKKITLDWQSRTSVNLCRILADEYWGISPEWLQGSGDIIKSIQGHTAAVVIGDRALDHFGNFPYQYDLAKEWHTFTGLPFTFACWVAAPEVPADFIQRFEKALLFGLEHIDEVIETEIPNYPAAYQVKKYLSNTISYTFDQQKKKGLETFLQFLGKIIQHTPA
ncbi:MAG: menaquinone biosynthesis protein [Bacteroidia bacterium]|nr:menaquinone biosynthesis protein [Bacteroidia bacterium]